MHGSALTVQDWPSILVLILIGGLASAINAVAGGGSLITFPILTGIHIPGHWMGRTAKDVSVGFNIEMRSANATNSASLWLGSLAGGLGFINLLPKTAHYMRTFWFPTVVGSALGAWLLIASDEKFFAKVVPALLLIATVLLVLQPNIKEWAAHREAKVPFWLAVTLQLLVSVYGGYFGAGMGIMMLAVFTLYMEGNIHEINAVKNWLGLIINLICSAVFVFRGLVLLLPWLALTVGAVVGGFFAAKHSQKVDPEKLRKVIAVYGLITTCYFAYQNWF